MSRVMAQPIGQKRLTNIAVVRYKKMGKRFEIACYKNKVLNWRNGIEKDLDEVVQTITIFTNVSKGVLAKHEDLQLVFGTTNQDKICRIILTEGEMQVSEKERKLQYDTLFKDIASVLVAKCVNSETNRPYTISMLERSLKDIHFAVDPKRGAKQQALEAVGELQKVLPIRRAMMRLKLQVAPAAETELEQLLRKEHAVIESQSSNQSQVMVVCLVEPGCFREVHSFIQTATGGGGRIDVVSLAATEEGDGSTEFEASAAGFAERLQISANREQAASVARAASASLTGAGFVAVSTAGIRSHRDHVTRAADSGSPLYEGPVADMPEEHASRRERFAELDQLQPGWIVQLRTRGDAGTVDANFVSPAGERVASFAIARRAALAASKAAKE